MNKDAGCNRVEMKEIIGCKNGRIELEVWWDFWLRWGENCEGD
ncbi:hypothetical protein [Bacillus thuringiensis]|nr:hypothetical protein [Bacillus thuringiensis]